MGKEPANILSVRCCSCVPQAFGDSYPKDLRCNSRACWWICWSDRFKFDNMERGCRVGFSPYICRSIGWLFILAFSLLVSVSETGPDVTFDMVSASTQWVPSWMVLLLTELSSHSLEHFWTSFLTLPELFVSLPFPKFASSGLQPTTLSDLARMDLPINLLRHLLISELSPTAWSGAQLTEMRSAQHTMLL